MGSFHGRTCFLFAFYVSSFAVDLRSLHFFVGVFSFSVFLLLWAG